MESSYLVVLDSVPDLPGVVDHDHHENNRTSAEENVVQD
jgi:hypothetical protein